MEVAECTKIVLSRIQKLEPENVTKIIGYLLLNHNHQEIIQYAYGPDKLIHSLIAEAKAYLSSPPKPYIPAPLQPLPEHSLPHSTFSPAISRPFSSPSSFRVPAPYWDTNLVTGQQPGIDNFDLPPPSHNDSVGGLHNQAEFLSLEEQLQSLNSFGPDFPSNCYYPEAALNGGLGPMAGMRSPPGVPEFTSRACHYFYKGFCKHGINCRYLHDQVVPDNLSPAYSLNMNELVNDDHVFAPGSLEKLEMEITELLRARRGLPVSIASLPMLYHEMYGRTLQAEGYLTESQRHGKAGLSLTKVLARLRNSIRLIDRPHGQHSVILAEDAPKYMDYRNERSDSGIAPGSSHQIYLTFPAESTFTEDDVLNYFKQYGPVRDVRIPRQEKRMFGFVSFIYPETVKLILAKGHPHYICGARVLVKPYKEKTRPNDRRYTEKIDLPMYIPNYFEMDSNHNSTFHFPAVPRWCEHPKLLEKQLIQDHEQVLEFERRRLFELQLTPKTLTQHPYYGHRTDELKLAEDHFSFLPALKNCSPSDEKTRHTSNSSSDQDSGHIELPDSPFASPR